MNKKQLMGEYCVHCGKKLSKRTVKTLEKAIFAMRKRILSK